MAETRDILAIAEKYSVAPQEEPKRDILSIAKKYAAPEQPTVAPTEQAPVPQAGGRNILDIAKKYEQPAAAPSPAMTAFQSRLPPATTDSAPASSPDAPPQIERSPVGGPAGGVPQAPQEDLPVGTLHNLPGATNKFITEDTYVSQQAASYLTLLADFVPSAVRGARELNDQIGRKVVGKDRFDRWQKFQRDLPIVKQIADMGEAVLDSSGKLRQDIKTQLITDAKDKGGLKGVAVSQLTEAFEETALTLMAFKLL